MHRLGAGHSGIFRAARATWRVSATLAALALVFADHSVAQGNVPLAKPVPSLDRFDSSHGFPAYPASTAPNSDYRQVPYIFYGGNVNALRLNDVPKIHLEQKPIRKRP